MTRERNEGRGARTPRPSRPAWMRGKAMSKYTTSATTTPAAPVKSTRRFGAGILPTHPVYLADHTSEDAAWLIEDNARRELRAECDRLFPRIGPTEAFKSAMRRACRFVASRMEDERLDALYTDRLAEESMTAGFIPYGVEAAEVAEFGIRVGSPAYAC